MARILLIDDDATLLDVLALAFEDADHEVLLARDGRAGLRSAREDAPDAVVCDVNLPHLDGFTLCRTLREGGDAVPIVLLTARDSEIDEALGLDLGADDYVSKPFSTRVLLARVRALLRRRELPEAHPRTVGALVLDPDRLEARYDGHRIETTVTEFRLLQALTERPGVVFSRERLLVRAREDDSVVTERLIDTYVRRLRRKFEAVAPSFDEIETVIGAGYRWRG